VAWARARESSRPFADALINDPFARLFVPEDTVELPDGFQMNESLINLVAVRTRLIDDSMIHSLSNRGGIEQVVVLGAGLDTRPWRLSLSNDEEVDASKVRYFELDFPELFAFKCPKLHAEGAMPLFSYKALSVDLSLNWRDELLREEVGFNVEAKTLFLLEGLTGYLTEEENIKMFTSISSIAAPGSQLLATFLSNKTEVKTNMHRFQPHDPLGFLVSNFPCWSGVSIALQDTATVEYARTCEGFDGYCLVKVHMHSDAVGKNTQALAATSAPTANNTTAAEIDVYAGGDGGTWSCSPSFCYRIPTDLFDLNMAIGALNTREDLFALSEQARKEIEAGTRNGSAPFVEVWAAPDGNWAGTPSIHLKVPVDIFAYLIEQGERASRKLGWLTCQEDVDALVASVRSEIEEEAAAGDEEKGVCGLCGLHRVLIFYSQVEDQEGQEGQEGGEGGEGEGDTRLLKSSCKKCKLLVQGARAVHTARTETKLCGHLCTTSCLKEGCCACLDLRPVRADAMSYPSYSDGEGWADTASRGAGYCPYCAY